jgi:cation diffusion facilitator CzcD-associated flavoprotein CzcO
MEEKEGETSRVQWNAGEAILWSVWFMVKSITLYFYEVFKPLVTGTVDVIGGDPKQFQENIAKCKKSPAKVKYANFDTVHEVDVLVIGAGFAGLCMGYFLNLFGISNVIVEKADRIGGVWNYNTYPNAACDVPSVFYSFSFAKYPPGGWSRKYAPCAEILKYMNWFSEKFGIMTNVLLNTKVDDAEFVDKTDFRGWNVNCSSSSNQPLRFKAKFFISSIGQLGVPKCPENAGLTWKDIHLSKSSKTRVFHSAEWDHDYDFSGKTVAIIGNGPSSIQLTPHVIKHSKKVFLFCRSLPVIIPKMDFSTSSWFARSPIFTEPYRIGFHFYLELVSLLFDLNPVSRALERFVLPKLVIPLMKLFVKKEHHKDLLPDIRFPMGCKRICVDDGPFLNSVQKPHVTIVRSEISHFDSEKAQIIGKDGNVISGLDCIVLATGFDSTNFLSTFKVVGKNGETIKQKWGSAPVSYYGMTVPSFPNFFVVYGPGTNTGAGSIIFFIECQARYIVSAILAALEKSKDKPLIELKESVYKSYVREFRRRIGNTTFSAGCNSWYKTADGTVVNNWFGLSTEFWLRTRNFDAESYNISK